MILNNWGVRLLVAVLALAGTLACSTSGLFVAEATVTPTRTPRPTFTPLPQVTDTPLPLPTLPPPPPPTPLPVVVVKSPTKPPTAKPATAKPPTVKPTTAAVATVAQPPTAVPPTAVPQQTFQYGVNPPSCQHAGGTYIKGKVYDGTDPSSGGVAGIRVALGPADASTIWEQVKSFDDGVYSFTLESDGKPARVGSYWIWLMDGSGKRISPVSGAININGKGPDAPDACWAGSVDFWKR